MVPASIEKTQIICEQESDGDGDGREKNERKTESGVVG